MRIKLPKLFVIGDQLYRLKRVKQVERDSKVMETIGQCDSSKHEITLRTRLTPAAELEAFIHESLHGLEAEYDFKIPHWLVYKISKGLARMILDNQFG